MSLFQPNLASQPENGQPPYADHVSKTAVEILKVEQNRSTWGERLSDRITAFTGSMLFVLFNAALFCVWIVLNLTGSELAFDPYPFNLLTMAVSLEAIFLSTFVLMSQNRQAKQSDRRAKVDLQIDMIAEQEITRLMRLVLDIHQRLGIRSEHDAELRDMQKTTQIAKLIKTADHDSAARSQIEISR